MDLVIAQSPVLHFEDDNGKPLVGGYIEVFLNGTTSPVAVTWGANGEHNESIVRLDSRGECVILLDYTKVYSFVLHRADNSVIWKRDNIIAQNIADNSIDSTKLKNPKMLIADGSVLDMKNFGDDYLVLTLKKPSDESKNYALKFNDGEIKWVQDV